MNTRFYASMRLLAIALAACMPAISTANKNDHRKHSRPQFLTTDMLAPTTAPTYGVAGQVCSASPTFGWSLPGSSHQTACRILVATSEKALREGKADVWDSGRMSGGNSVAVPYRSTPLEPGRQYWWTVKVWSTNEANGKEERESQYARPAQFATATVLDSCFSHHPLMKSRQEPVKTLHPEAETTFYDFGKNAFSQLTLKVTSSEDSGSITIHLGEAADGNRVNRKPQGTVRYARYTLKLRRGTHIYGLQLRSDPRNTAQGKNESHTDPILMPTSIGEVYPFRYVEVEGKARVKGVWREMVHEPFCEEASSFSSSDTVLNMVWDLCKYSIKATSFAGIYVDGDRERIPYEADALVNQLSHYVADNEYTMARRSVAHLIEHPTWPTEWILLCPRMAWNDYMYTGDMRLLKKYYHDLAAKTLAPLRDSRGLISTRTGLVTDSVRKSVHFKGSVIRDIVDWPQDGAAGIEKEAGGEADGHEMCNINTVVNAYHYDALHIMSMIAGVLGEETDSIHFVQMAALTAKSMNTLLWNEDKGAYTDGEESRHCSQHSSMFCLAFGIVPPDRTQRVAWHVQQRGMACSVYGAQFLLDALYMAGRDTFARELLCSTGLRSWYNMLRMGSTITTEAWDNVFKPNLDWNHAWGAAAGNIIARQLMGIQPLSPGFAAVSIRPQPGGLQHASITHPTPRGQIKLAFTRRDDGCYDMDISIPANTKATLTTPTTKKKMELGPGQHYIKE